MRAPRLLLLLCLAVGLGAVWFAARAHLEDRRRGKEERAADVVRFQLRSKARALKASLERRLADAEPVARYDAAGRLVRPAPPAEARPFAPATGSLAALYLARGDYAAALENAGTSAERAAR